MSTDDRSKPAERLNLRFDGELNRQLEEAARRSCRSRNGEAVYRLKQSFQQPEEAA